LLKDAQLGALETPPDRDYCNLFNWVIEHGKLEEGQSDFIFKKKDFIALTGGNTPRTRIIEILSGLLHLRPQSRVNGVFGSTTQPVSKNELIHHFSVDKLAFFVETIIIVLTVGLLLLPVCLLFLLSMTRILMFVVVLIFVIAFSIVLALFTEAKTQEVLVGVAAYTAVLITLLGNVGYGDFGS